MVQPKVRIKGFNGEWERKRIGEVADVIGGGTPSTTVEEYWNGGIRWFTPSEVGNSRYISDSERTISQLGLDNSSAKWIPAYSILLSSRATIGEASINTQACCTNQGFQSLIPKDVDLEFLYSMLPTIKKDLIRESSGSTFLEISANKVKNMKIFVPREVEQRVVGEYFRSLDALIQTTTKKIASLKQLKSASLVSMFPQNGEKTPRIRFKGFEGEWSYEKIGDCLDEIIVKNSPIQTDFILSLTIKDGVLPYSRKGNIGNRAKEDVTQYKLAYPNTIVLNSMNILIGAIGLCDYLGCVSPVYCVFKCREIVNRRFIFDIMANRQFQTELKKIANGVMEIRQKISVKELLEKKILIPTIEEQSLISSYFSSLDSQISIQEQRLEKLKQIKAACLKNMFI